MTPVTRCSVLYGVVFMVAAFPGAAGAQRPHRSGLWGELGGGPSSVRIACSGCADVTRRSGSGGYFRVGGAVSDRILIGVEAFSLVDEAFGFSEGDTSIVAENVSLAGVVLWYPGRTGIFLKAGVGLASGEFTIPGTPEPVVSQGIGTGLTFGIGFDLPIWRGLAVTGNAGTWVTAIGDVVLPDATVDDVIATLYGLTFGFTLR
ncbi:MAG: hypothetical protein PVH00_06540 [Gemmatimonadota bacterium]|jgi:hypothetical protein